MHPGIPAPHPKLHMQINSTSALTRGTLAPFLFDHLRRFAEWPPELDQVPAMVTGSAFFPGGCGLWQPERELEFPDIMVVAQDFSTTAEHSAMLAGRTRDLDSATWRNFRPFASAAGLDLCRCFFTNSVMGLRKQGPSDGKNPGYKRRNSGFVVATHDFLRLQVQTVRPRLIVVLGTPAAGIFAAAAPSLERWKGCNFSQLDAGELAFLPSVDISGVTTACVVLLHPSYRHANLRYRRFQEHVGNDAELALLRHAIAKSL